MNNYDYLPIIGQGSQPKEADGVDLAIMQMPASMTTYSKPQLPADINPKNIPQATSLLLSIVETLKHYDPIKNYVFNTQDLNANELNFIDEILGEGEVSIIYQDDAQQTRIQESVLAGLWRVQTFSLENKLISDHIEVGNIPDLIKQQTFNRAAKQIHFDSRVLPDGLMNALPLIAELNAKITDDAAENTPHIINLSLLPQTEQDLTFLRQCLGIGKVSILSRGYGATRISSTATDKVWWVQYFNSDDTLILNTLEVSSVPEVACAALEDIADSCTRLQEILAAY